MHISQAAFDPIVIKGQGLVVHSQKVQDGGMEIMPVHRVAGYLETDLISLAVTYSTFYTTTSKPRCKRIWIMITSWCFPFLS